MSDITFQFEEEAGQGRLIGRVAGYDEPAEMTFTRRAPDLISLDHTGVPDSLGGQGVGKELSAEIVRLAREQGFKIVPRCPYFKAQVDKHTDWADVIAAGD